LILWAVRRYRQFAISNRELEFMLQDRGGSVDHTTIFRWTQAYATVYRPRFLGHRIEPYAALATD
jgi:transposase, IS6 family